MENAATLPVDIAPEAARAVEQLGLQRELQSLLQSVAVHFSGVREIIVSLHQEPENSDSRRVLIEVRREGGDSLGTESVDRWSRWVVTSFSPDVFRHFNLIESFEGSSES